MKKIVILLILLTFIGLPLVAQVTFDEYERGFQVFADGVANALPFNSPIGLNWSDAYIGQFPRFGAGAFFQFGNAFSAASIALIVSSFVPAGKVASTSPVAGFFVSIILLPVDFVHFPFIYKL